MRLSELRPVIRMLHANGWYKVKGLQGYRKTWRFGLVAFSQLLLPYELLGSQIPVKDILEYHEAIAQRKRKEYYG